MIYGTLADSIFCDRWNSEVLRLWKWKICFDKIVLKEKKMIVSTSLSIGTMMQICLLKQPRTLKMLQIAYFFVSTFSTKVHCAHVFIQDIQL